MLIAACCPHCLREASKVSWPSVAVMFMRFSPALPRQWHNRVSLLVKQTAAQSHLVLIDHESFPDIGTETNYRSSRRALILQMAKARMKSNKEQPTSPDSKMNLSIREEADQRQQDADQEPNNETGADIDFSGDLD